MVVHHIARPRVRTSSAGSTEGQDSDDGEDDCEKRADTGCHEQELVVRVVQHESYCAQSTRQPGAGLSERSTGFGERPAAMASTMGPSDVPVSLFIGCAVYFQYRSIAAGSLVVSVLLFCIARRLGVLRNRVPCHCVARRYFR